MKTIQPFSWTRAIPRLFLYFIIPLSVVLIIVIVVSQTIHHQEMEELAGSRDLRAVQSTVRTMENSLYTLQEDISRAVEAYQGGAAPGQVDPWMHDFDRGVFQAVCANGVVLPFEGNQIPPEAVTIQVLCQTIRESGINGTAFRLETGQPAILWIAQPLDDSDILVGGVDLAGLIERSLVAPADPEQFSIQVYDSDHLLLYDSGRMPVNDHDLYHQSVLNGLAGQFGVVYPGGSHGAHIVAYAPIEPVDWVLMMDEAWEDVSTPSLQLTQSIPLILIPVLMLAVAGLFFAVRWVIQPLQKLSGQTAQLENSSLEAFEYPVGGILEIRNLQTVLREMYLRWLDAQQNLEQYIGGLTDSQEAERKKLARDLHDDVIQDLIALKQDSQHRQQSLEEITKIQEVIDRLRQFIRGLRPPYLDDLGWLTAVKSLVEEFQTESGIQIKLEVEGTEKRLAPEKELVLYRVVQEALANTRKHAGATSIKIAIHFLDGGVRMQIEDDGAGFDMPARLDQLARDGHYGLLGMKERIEMAGGRIEIISDRESGTTIDLFL